MASRGTALRVLVHLREPAHWPAVEASIRARGHTAEGTFVLAEGLLRIAQGGYDRIFIGRGISHDDRLALIAQAGATATSVIEITDANTIIRELLRSEMSGGYRTLPPPTGRDSVHPTDA